MTNIVKFPQEPDADECLESAKGVFKEVTIVGFSEDGTFVMSGNMGVGDAYMTLGAAMSILIEGMFGGDDDMAH